MSTDPTVVDPNAPTTADAPTATAPAPDAGPAGTPVPADTPPAAPAPAGPDLGTERVLFIYGCRTCPVEMAIRGRYALLDDPTGAVAGTAIPDADLPTAGHPDLRFLAGRATCPICGLGLYAKSTEIFVPATPEPTEENPNPEVPVSAPAGETVSADQAQPVATGNVAVMQEQAAAETAASTAPAAETTSPAASTGASAEAPSSQSPVPADVQQVGPVTPDQAAVNTPNTTTGPAAPEAPAAPSEPVTDQPNEPSGWTP